jgi:GNAT superfamily N-acetyltransferase
MNQGRIPKPILIRFAEPDEGPLILQFIRALAEYEHLLDAVKATEEQITTSIFNEKKAEVVIAEDDGTPVGFALFFHTFSTFVGRPGLYLEDLFVKPAYRGRGVGKLLMSFLAKTAVDRGYGRFEWACLDWNEASIQFYKNRGARPMDAWTTYRVDGEALLELGKQFPGL